MNERLPRLTAAQMIKILERSGFVLTRQSGSHLIYKNAGGRRATVPYHSGKILHPKILKNIMKETNLSVQDLLRIL